MAWQVLPATQRGVWRLEWERLLARVRRGIPRGLPVDVLADRGLGAAWLLERVRRYGGAFAAARQPAGAVSGAVAATGAAVDGLLPCAGHAGGGGVRVSVGIAVDFGGVLGASAREPWYLLTNLPASVVGAWYGLRSWIEQGFRQFKSGGWGCHRTRVVESEGVFMSWLVSTLGQWVVALGVGVRDRVRLWDGVRWVWGRWRGMWGRNFGVRQRR